MVLEQETQRAAHLDAETCRHPPTHALVDQEHRTLPLGSQRNGLGLPAPEERAQRRDQLVPPRSLPHDPPRRRGLGGAIPTAPPHHHLRVHARRNDHSPEQQA